MKNTLSASTTITTTKSMTVISISSAILLVGALRNDNGSRAIICTKIMPTGHHTAAYIAGYKMGCTDGPDQENFVGSGGVAHHTRAFRIGV